MADAAAQRFRRRPPDDQGTSRGLMIAGMAATILLGTVAARLVSGLATSDEPTPLGTYEIPAFNELLACDAYFSHQILQRKNGGAATLGPDDMDVLHRNYRRLHRLMRQVGRRDGITPEEQTRRLRQQVRRLEEDRNRSAATVHARAQDARCRAMAELPIARKRHSQLIIGR